MRSARLTPPEKNRGSSDGAVLRTFCGPRFSDLTTWFLTDYLALRIWFRKE